MASSMSESHPCRKLIINNTYNPENWLQTPARRKRHSLEHSQAWMIPYLSFFRRRMAMIPVFFFFLLFALDVGFPWLNEWYQQVTGNKQTKMSSRLPHNALALLLITGSLSSLFTHEPFCPHRIINWYQMSDLNFRQKALQNNNNNNKNASR